MLPCSVQSAVISLLHVILDLKSHLTLLWVHKTAGTVVWIGVPVDYRMSLEKNTSLQEKMMALKELVIGKITVNLRKLIDSMYEWMHVVLKRIPNILLIEEYGLKRFFKDNIHHLLHNHYLGRCCDRLTLWYGNFILSDSLHLDLLNASKWAIFLLSSLWADYVALITNGRSLHHVISSC